jgi:hypothetical protein
MPLPDFTDYSRPIGGDHPVLLLEAGLTLVYIDVENSRSIIIGPCPHGQHYHIQVTSVVFQHRKSLEMIEVTARAAAHALPLEFSQFRVCSQSEFDRFIEDAKKSGIGPFDLQDDTSDLEEVIDRLVDNIAQMFESENNHE